MNAKEFYFDKDIQPDDYLTADFWFEFAQDFSTHQNKQLIEALESSIGLLELIDDGVGFNEDLLHNIIKKGKALQTIKEK